MKLTLNFDETPIWESIYDTLCLFFRDEENMKTFLSEETRHDTLINLTNEIKYILDDTLPDEIDVFHAF